jgi:hypothetical protein
LQLNPPTESSNSGLPGLQLLIGISSSFPLFYELTAIGSVQGNVKSAPWEFLFSIFNDKVYMKKIFSFILAAFFSSMTFSQTWTRPGEASKHIGDSIIIIGFVTNVQRLTDRKEAPTLVTIGDKNEIELLILLIPGADRQNFTQTPETAYLNQYVQVTGRVLLYKGKTQITLYSEKQISIARDAMLNTPVRDRFRNF